MPFDPAPATNHYAAFGLRPGEVSPAPSDQTSAPGHSAAGFLAYHALAYAEKPLLGQQENLLPPRPVQCRQSAAGVHHAPQPRARQSLPCKARFPPRPSCSRSYGSNKRSETGPSDCEESSDRSPCRRSASLRSWSAHQISSFRFLLPHGEASWPGAQPSVDFPTPDTTTTT